MATHEDVWAAEATEFGDVAADLVTPNPPALTRLARAFLTVKKDAC